MDMEIITFQPSFTDLYQQILTPRPEPFLRGKGEGLNVRPPHLHRRRDAGAKESPSLIRNHWSLANTDLTPPLETERGGGSHSIWHVVPSIVPFEILRVGGEAICRVWLIFFFYANIPLLENFLFLIKFEIPKGKGHVSPSLLCMMPNTLWMVNKCHIIFILHWLRMAFSHESCFNFSANLKKCMYFPRKRHCLREVVCLNLFSKFPLMLHLPFPWANGLPPVLHLFYSLFALATTEFTCESLTPYLMTLCVFGERCW